MKFSEMDEIYARYPKLPREYQSTAIAEVIAGVERERDDAISLLRQARDERREGMMMHYILNAAGDPVPEPDVLRWAQWYKTADRQVAVTKLPGDVRVSTVFLGLDHGFGGEVLLFETMIFGGPLDETQDRYTTREAALAGHDHYVKLAQDA